MDVLNESGAPHTFQMIDNVPGSQHDEQMGDTVFRRNR